MKLMGKIGSVPSYERRVDEVFEGHSLRYGAATGMFVLCFAFNHV